MADVVLWNANPFSTYARPNECGSMAPSCTSAATPRMRLVSELRAGQPGEGDVEVIRPLIAALLATAHLRFCPDHRHHRSVRPWLLGDGSGPIPRARCVISPTGRDRAAGLIARRVSLAGAQTIDASGKWVTPGIVAGFLAGLGYPKLISPAA